MKRHRFKQTSSLEQRIAENVQRLREQLETAPAGTERERLTRKLRQAETASQLSNWLALPGPQAGI
jgi:hypothetical protein